MKLSRDKELGKSVNNVDIIVGAHFYNYLGKVSAKDEYPPVFTAPNGKHVLVVTPKFATQYLGELNAVFDEKDVLKNWSGEAKELENYMPLEPKIYKTIKENTSALNEFKNKIIGSHSVEINNGLDKCRKGECFGGLLASDAILEFSRAFGVDVALTNGGSICFGMPKGDIPFGGMFVLRCYGGEQILAALEQGVSGEGNVEPRLFHPTGLKYLKPCGQKSNKGYNHRQRQQRTTTRSKD